MVVDDEVWRCELCRRHYRDGYTPTTEACLISAQAYVLVYNVTSRRSFESIRDQQSMVESCFLRELQVSRNKSWRAGWKKPALGGLIANKCDLGEMRQVSKAEGENLARELGCQFWENSAKDRVNIEEAFMGMARAYKESRLAKPIELVEKPLPEPTAVTKAVPKQRWWKRVRPLGRQRT